MPHRSAPAAPPRGAGVFDPATLRLLYAGFWAGQICLAQLVYHYVGSPSAWVTALFDTLSWMVVGTLCFAVGYLLPLDGGPTLRQAAALVVGALGVGLVRELVIQGVGPFIGWGSSDFAYRFITGLPGDLIINTSYVGLGCGVASAMRNEREQARLAELDARVADTRLAAVRTHLRPEFVLRAMQALADQLPADAPAAVRGIGEFSELLSLQLRRTRHARVTVDEEVDFVRRYAALDARHAAAPTHLRVRVDEAARAVPIPANCIAILLESVLRARGAPARAVAVEVRVGMRGGAVEIRVRDDLPVPVGARDPHGWEAVAELAESLRGHFGPASVPVFADDGAGVESRLVIPAGPVAP